MKKSVNIEKIRNTEYLKLALGFTLSTLTTPLLNSVDTAVVGNLSNPVFIGGVTLGGTIFNTIYWLFGFLRVSTSGYSAKAFGENNEKEEITVLIRPVLISLILGFLFVIFQKPILWGFIHFFDAGKEITKYIEIYFNILIWGAPFVFLNYTFLGWIMGRKEIKKCLILQLMTNIVNIFLDLYFVEVLRMDVTGVAAATLISQLMTTLLSIFIILRTFSLKKILYNINLKEIFDRSEIKKVGAVNSDLVIRTVCLLIATNLFLEKAAHNGKIILAANSILFQVQYLMSYIFDGFANASSVFSGIAAGEKNFRKLKWVMRKSIHFCIIISAFLSIAFILGGEKLLLFYTKNTEVVNTASQYKMWIALFPIVISFGLVIYGNFTGATETAYIRNSMLQSLVIFLIVYFTVIPAYQNHGLWLSFIVFSLARSLFLMRYVKKFMEKYKSELNVRTSINRGI
ncbi:MATE family efflux transporter [Leptotrichia sp. oral taxon 879]|uniref:MATE family efflux transporter n=1 Tax=Leptotrichia sp. oral taxon 879 TaxID=1227267 RepID=UPI0003AD7E2D|nr:MATE family efflux transporter [Leptotrichia sp. oral taxon 879]ERK50354.1 MATE efflux family protein [Leptotrichia sp. oral taxon 879 str. F0557]